MSSHQSQENNRINLPSGVDVDRNRFVAYCLGDPANVKAYTGYFFGQPLSLAVRLSVCYGCIAAKRYEIRPMLLLITNRKSHKPLNMT